MNAIILQYLSSITSYLRKKKTDDYYTSALNKFCIQLFLILYMYLYDATYCTYAHPVFYRTSESTNYKSDCIQFNYMYTDIIGQQLKTMI